MLIITIRNVPELPSKVLQELRRTIVSAIAAVPLSPRPFKKAKVVLLQSNEDRDDRLNVNIAGIFHCSIEDLRLLTQAVKGAIEKFTQNSLPGQVTNVHDPVDIRQEKVQFQYNETTYEVDALPIMKNGGAKVYLPDGRIIGARWHTDFFPPEFDHVWCNTGMNHYGSIQARKVK